MTFGALAVTAADVAFFSPPPHRPERPERRTDKGTSVTRSFLRAFRRELAHVVGVVPGSPRSNSSH